jgi:hypothetical protein
MVIVDCRAGNSQLPFSHGNFYTIRVVQGGGKHDLGSACATMELAWIEEAKAKGPRSTYV